MSVIRRSYSTDLTDATMANSQTAPARRQTGRQTASLSELRRAMQRDKQPSAAIVDSQSVKTTEKGGRSEVMTAARRAPNANGTSSLTQPDC